MKQYPQKFRWFCQRDKATPWHNSSSNALCFFPFVYFIWRFFKHRRDIVTHIEKRAGLALQHGFCFHQSNSPLPHHGWITKCWKYQSKMAFIQSFSYFLFCIKAFCILHSTTFLLFLKDTYFCFLNRNWCLFFNWNCISMSGINSNVPFTIWMVHWTIWTITQFVIAAQKMVRSSDQILTPGKENRVLENWSFRKGNK